MLFEAGVTPFLVNVAHGHRPAVVLANGPTKNLINWYGNYVPGAWNANDQVREQPMPYGSSDHVLIAIFQHSAHLALRTTWT